MWPGLFMDWFCARGFKSILSHMVWSAHVLVLRAQFWSDYVTCVLVCSWTGFARAVLRRFCYIWFGLLMYWFCARSFGPILLHVAWSAHGLVLRARVYVDFVTYGVVCSCIGFARAVLE